MTADESLSSDVISEGTNIDLFAEACLVGLCFERLHLVTNALMAFAVLPFGFCWQRFSTIWRAAD